MALAVMTRRYRVPRKDAGYSPNEAAAILSQYGASVGLSVSGRTLLRSIKRGEIEARRTPGGYYRISKDELERVLCVMLDTRDTQA
jgi:excisionase family DNA binding protein